MKKILIVGPTAGLSGVDQTLRMLCIGLKKRGHEVVVVLPRESEIFADLKINNVDIIETTLIKWWFNPAFYDNFLYQAIDAAKPSINYLLRVIKTHDPDIIISNTSVFLDAYFAARISGKPHVTHLHALFVSNIYTQMTEGIKSSVYKMLSTDSIICVPAKALKKTLVSEFGIKPDKVCVVPNGIDVGFFCEVDRSNSNVVSILSLGHFNDNKNQLFLIEVALGLVRKQFHNFIIRLQGPAETDYLNVLNSEIDKHGLSSYFEIFPSVANVLPSLHASDIYVNVSKTETFPISLLEAMSTGLPCVCTPTVGALSIIKNEESGFIAEDVDSFCSIVYSLCISGAFRKKIGQQARDHVVRNFTVDTFVDGFLNVLNYSIHKAKISDRPPEHWMVDFFFQYHHNEASTKKPRIGIVVPDRHQTSYVLLVDKPFSFYEKNENISFEVFSHSQIMSLKSSDYDLIYVLRSFSHEVVSVVSEAKGFGIPVVFETDDNYFALYFSNGEPVHSSCDNDLLKQVVELADHVLVYSETMKSRIINLNTHVTKLNAYQLNYPPVASDKTNADVVIGFMGSLKKDVDFLFVVPALLQLLTELPNLKLEFFGFVPNDLVGHPRVTIFDFDSDYDRFIQKFKARLWSIALAPLEDTEFNRSKTNNKYREYASAGYAGIYSNISPYSETVKDGVTGLLVENTVKAWYDGINRLLNDVDLAKRIAVAARADIVKNYMFESHVRDKWIVIKKLIDKSVIKKNDAVFDDLKCTWYPVRQYKMWSCDFNLSKVKYCSQLISGVEGELIGINFIPKAFVRSPDNYFGVEIVCDGKIVGHYLKSSMHLNGGEVATFNFRINGVSRFSVFEIRLFAASNVGDMFVSGVRSLFSMSFKPSIGVVAASLSR